MLPQKLVILWVTLAPGWDTRPDWGHKLVLDLLPGVLLKVSLDGTRLWNFPLQFCIEENKRAMNAGSKLEKVHPCFPSFLLPPWKVGPYSIPSPPLPHPGPKPLSCTHSSWALPSDSHYCWHRFQPRAQGYCSAAHQQQSQCLPATSTARSAKEVIDTKQQL